MGLRDTLRYGDHLPPGMRGWGSIFLAFSHDGTKMYVAAAHSFSQGSESFGRSVGTVDASRIDIYESEQEQQK